MSYSQHKEWQRLRADFEALASQYLDLRLSVYYVVGGRPTSDATFPEPNHAINLWQYFGDMTAVGSFERIDSSTLTRFGMSGAEVTAYGVIVGAETDLFRRMAERAGSLIPEEINRRITLEIAGKFHEGEGKPAYTCNQNPLARWLNLVLVTIATYQPQRLRAETLTVDPFTASLVALDFVMGQMAHPAAVTPEVKPATGLLPVALQQLGHEVRSLAVTLHCCNQDLNEDPSTRLMQRVHEQIQRIHALLPNPLSLADCNVMARGTLQRLLEWLEAVEPQLKVALPPFRIAELDLIYTLASEFDRHADADARRKSVAPPFTELQRQQLQEKYGATERLRRRQAGEQDDPVERINAGMTEALRRFPDMQRWTIDDWSWLFFCGAEVIVATATWRSLAAGALPQAPQAKGQSTLMTRILFLSAAPVQLDRLRVDDEVREIESKIRAADHRDSLQFITKWAIRPDDLLQSLNEHRPHIVHFSGHGNLQEIAVLDRSGGLTTVTADSLVSLFRSLKDNIRLVVLNACFSRSQAEAIAEYIDCAIGMKCEIGDAAAIVFAASFYRAIGFGRSVKDAFEQGRTALLLEGIGEQDTPELIMRPGVAPESIVLVNPQ